MTDLSSIVPRVSSEQFFSKSYGVGVCGLFPCPSSLHSVYAIMQYWIPFAPFLGERLGGFLPTKWNVTEDIKSWNRPMIF